MRHSALLWHAHMLHQVVDYYIVPEPVRLGPGEELFDFLAECIEDFLKKRKLTGHKLQLGELLVESSIVVIVQIDGWVVYNSSLITDLR